MPKRLVLILLAASMMNGQDRAGAAGQRTQSPGSARYELAESGNVAVRVNRYTGETERRVDGAGGPRWEPVAVPDRPVAGAVPRFQLVPRENGLGLYLLDTETGQTWMSVQSGPRGGSGAFAWRKFVSAP